MANSLGNDRAKLSVGVVISGISSTLVCFNIKLTLLHNSVVLLLLGSSLESLPRKLTSEEVLIVSLFH
jgi:hypothetical protein